MAAFVACALLVVVTVAAVSIVVTSVLVGISPMPSSAKAQRAMVSLVEPNGPIAELGAGFGGVAVALARAFPRTNVVAFERSLIPFLVAKVRAAGMPNLDVRWQNFSSADLSGFSVLVCYLFTGGMTALAEKLAKEPAPLERTLVTNTFLLRGMVAEEERTLDDMYRTTVARYRLPARAALDTRP